MTDQRSSGDDRGSGARQRLDAAHTLAPDIVILDIGLPGISGYEVAEQLRADSSLSAPALIALAGGGGRMIAVKRWPRASMCI